MKAWRRGRHVRSVNELQEWRLPPLAQDSLGPPWLDKLLVAIILVLAVGSVVLVLSWPVQ